MLESFRIVVHHHGPDRCEVTVAGELDVLAAAEVRFVLQQAVATCPLTVVDLSGVRFCDCAGLSALLAAHRRARDRGVELQLRAVPPSVARLLRLTHSGDAFLIAPATAALPGVALPPGHAA
ncbi:STAS domain-containing protein [Streptomyces goshikiensis]